ncbi:MAG TPA: pyridoxine 5'-phosphate synthase [Verrucomicrobiales bacterium]|jgi:pyridoxine 5-phosphate synthase|nr:pyridoxine 5'-phosphate synthase [Verrucomicrobiales bacterium]
MFKLGVNIDHVATLRQARYARMPGAANEEPSILEAARECEAAGAHSITVHLREDRRHIHDRDVHLLRRELLIPLNLEMGNTREILEIACQVRPDYVCLVPENRQEITTEGGLNAAGLKDQLAPTIRRLQDAGAKVSLFIDPEPAHVAAAGELKADMIELHTGAYANNTGGDREAELIRLIAAGEQGHALGLQINAGHGITTGNLPPLKAIPHLLELNIGHHIVCRALLLGMRGAVREMLTAMNGA